MPFETFDKRAATSSTQPMITIQRGGPFSMNRAAREALGSPEYVELLYDREAHVIGFKPSTPESPYAYPVRPQGKNAATFTVAGQAFAKYYKLDVSTARRYVTKMIDDIMVLDLQGQSVDATGPRAATKRPLVNRDTPTP